MTLSSYDVIIYTGFFILPGYIMNEIIEALIPVKVHTEGIKTIKFLGYSVFNFTIWSWLFVLIYKNLSSTSVSYYVLLIMFTVITSTLSGIAIGLLRKFELIRKLFIRFRVQMVHPIPNAWEYKFSKIEEPRWLIITLGSGKCIYGYYGIKSLASSDMNNRDIYLEEIYELDENKNWTKVDRTDGIWINESEIKLIEYKK